MLTRYYDYFALHVLRVMRRRCPTDCLEVTQDFEMASYT